MADYVRDYTQIQSTTQTCLTSIAIGKFAGVVIDLAQDPRNVLRNVGVDPGKPGMRTHDSPRHDSTNKPAVAFIRIRTKERSATVALKNKVLTYFWRNVTQNQTNILGNFQFI